MGMITGLLTLPLAPVRGVMWVAEVVQAEAERQLEESGSPQRALADLEAARAAGELSDEDFATLHAEIVDLIIASQANEEGG